MPPSKIPPVILPEFFLGFPHGLCPGFLPGFLPELRQVLLLELHQKFFPGFFISGNLYKFNQQLLQELLEGFLLVFLSKSSAEFLSGFLQWLLSVLPQEFFPRFFWDSSSDLTSNFSKNSSCYFSTDLFRNFWKAFHRIPAEIHPETLVGILPRSLWKDFFWDSSLDFSHILSNDSIRNSTKYSPCDVFHGFFFRKPL